MEQQTNKTMEIKILTDKEVIFVLPFNDERCPIKAIAETLDGEYVAHFYGNDKQIKDWLNERISFKKFRTVKDMNDDPRIDEVMKEYDGGEYSWWAYCKSGFTFAGFDYGIHGIHEYTIKELLPYANSIEWYLDDPDLERTGIIDLRK